VTKWLREWLAANPSAAITLVHVDHFNSALSLGGEVLVLVGNPLAAELLGIKEKP
jgi:hypothetical protein